MRSKFQYGVSLGVVTLAFVAIVGTLSWRQATRGVDGEDALLAVDENDLHVVAPPRSGPVTTRFRVTNRGRRTVGFGKASTSCGCSVASIEPSLIDPGGVGSVDVQTTPPGAGLRSIEVTIPVVVDGSTVDRLSLRLSVEGSTPVPYVAMSSGPIRFGVVGRDEIPEVPIVLETREKVEERPWLSRVRTSDPNLEVRGAMSAEVGLGGGVVVRTYRYQARFTSAPSAGEHLGEIIFSPETGSQGPEYRLDFHAEVREPVQVFPPRLFASLDLGESLPTFVLSFTCSDQAAHLSLKPTDEMLTYFSVEEMGPPESGRCLRRLSLRQRPEATTSLPVAFETNHPGVPVVRIPCMIRIP